MDHLGVIAARLRKDAISSVKENHEELIDILSEVMYYDLCIYFVYLSGNAE